MTTSFTLFTYSGKSIDVFDPDPASIDPSDIARALSMQCRYGGHVKFHYSVAQHSVLLSDAVPIELRKAALIHDGAEAYLPDLPRPVKDRAPEYQEMDERLTRAVFERFGVPYTLMRDLKWYDVSICVDEMPTLIGYPDPELLNNGYRSLGVPIHPWSPADAETRFLSRFKYLFPGWEVANAA